MTTFQTHISINISETMNSLCYESEDGLLEGDWFLVKDTSSVQDTSSVIYDGDILPYLWTYNTADEHKKAPYFIPSQPVVAKIVSAQKNEEGVNLMNALIYTIQLEHGQQKWTIERRYTDFQNLHTKLSIFRAGKKITDPMKKLLKGDDPRRKNTATLSSLSANALEERRRSIMARDLEEKVCLDQKKGKNVLKYDGSLQKLQVGKLSAENVHANNDAISLTSSTVNKPNVFKVPHFPYMPDSLLGDDEIEERRISLELYLNGVLSVPHLLNYHSTAKFLGVSHFSFIDSLGDKHKEGVVQKRKGGHLDTPNLRLYCREYCVCCHWTKRWLLVKDSFIAYLDTKTNLVREVMLFDSKFHVAVNGTEVEGVEHGIEISNFTRNLMLKTDSDKDAHKWKTEILKTLNTKGKIWKEKHRFDSFFPVRENSRVQWLVDGKSFMEHAANMLELAKEEIFITDWCLTPELFMKRPPSNEKKWQIMEILKRKAEQGVRVSVMIWKEVKMATNVGSLHAKQTLTALHPNIKVVRHPDSIPIPSYWSHHEKTIIVDQSIAFIGGIDVCFGRWDDFTHKLTDLGPGFVNANVDVVDLPEDQKLRDTAKIIDPNSVSTTESYQHNTILHDKIESMKKNIENGSSKPSRGLTNLSTDSETKPDFARILKKYQEYVNSGEYKERQDREGTPPMHRKTGKLIKKLKELKENIHEHHYEVYEEFEKLLLEEYQKHLLNELTPDDTNRKLWIGKDYVNYIFKDIVDFDHAYLDIVDREKVPRLPWHDASSVVYGAVARDAARHFIQRWNQIKTQKFNYDDSYTFLMPKSYDNIEIERAFDQISVKCTVQFLRSACKWSCDIDTVNDNIQRAYVHMIKNAKHYIYIENQYFISMIGSSSVTNLICETLFERIVRAHRMNEKFRVFVLMPLLPAFEGQVGEPSGRNIQTILYWTYNSICKGPNSLLVKLENEIGDYEQYIGFYSLRTNADLCGQMVSELIYIHDKIIIVDDTCCLIGSANINDRSMLGIRDSEVALYIEDTEFVDSVMNGKPYKAGKFSSSFRHRLICEHLGLLNDKGTLIENPPIDVTDMICDEVYSEIQRIAKFNTVIYETLFKCYPTDNVRSFKQLYQYKRDAERSIAHTDRTKTINELANVQGNLVEYPLKFLCEENLAPPITSKEGLVSSSMFT